MHNPYGIQTITAVTMSTISQQLVGFLGARALYLTYEPRRKEGRQKNYSIDSFSCFPPRKSLVKGERLMRVEGKPELHKV